MSETVSCVLTCKHKKTICFTPFSVT